MTFKQQFQSLSQNDIETNVFTAIGAIVGNDFFAMTAGTGNHYNSMVGSGGGLGQFMQKPAVWNMLRSDRYTLELMQDALVYTLSYFPENYHEQMMFLGKSSGRDSDKMKETKLTAVETPSGKIAFSEARLIIECKLMAATTVSPDDLYSQEVKDFVRDEYQQEDHYRKIAFGEITDVWINSSVVISNHCI